MSADVIGGAINNDPLSNFKCTDSVFIGNSAVGSGGAIANDGNMTCATTRFVSNSAVGSGGAIGGSGTIYCSATNFSGNSAAAGGAVFTGAAQQNLNFNGCAFLGNSAGAGAGGAILQQGNSTMSSAVLEASTFEGNTAGCCYTGGYEANAQYTCLDATAGYSTSLQCCSAGQYIGGGNNGALLCKPCFSNALDCSGIVVGSTVATLPLMSGYWRETLQQESIRDCWNPGACKGGMAVAEGDPLNYCAEGYQGPYCAVCRDGYAGLSGYRCSKCTPSAAAVAFAGLALLMMALALVFRRLRIPVVVFQVLTQFVRVTGVLLPLHYLQFLRGLDFVNLDLTWLTAPACVANFNFYDRLLISTLAPPVVAMLIFTPRMVAVAVSHARGAASRGPPLLQRVIARDMNALLVFVFLIFSGVSLTVFQTFACDDTLPVAYLRADYSIRCYTPAHRAHMAYAAAMILVYPIGIPALFACTLRRHMLRQRQRGEALSVDPPPTTEAAASAAFLWRPYRTNAPYYECAECVRRLLLTGVLVFITPGTAGQSAAACVFAFATSVAYDHVRPHRARSDACLYVVGYIVIFASMFTALLMQGAYINDVSQAAIGGLLIALNVLLVLLAIGQVYVGMSSKSWDWNASLNALIVVFAERF
ncbi:hypothetical protein JKP88DRAFT_279979 [Tribonema minus]|uniref:Uncharacterized protein n=1 Tax=Tribonema minus TaxID=303371 RepID=A0A836CBB8_9STRA|nr:hypothetical protein JKP88DRAFT_279979 [Tribonema minus]